MSLNDILEFLKSLMTAKGDLGAILNAPIAILALFGTVLLALTKSLVDQGKHTWAASSFAASVTLFAAFAVLTGGKGVPSDEGANQASASFEMHEGQVFIAAGAPGTLKRYEGGTVEACKRACAADSLCRAFTFDRDLKTCDVKPAVTALHPFPSATSGIKAPATTKPAGR